MKLKYKVAGQGTRTIIVKDVNEAQMAFADHRSGRLERDDYNYIAFGSSELLDVPTVTNDGRVVARLNYNGSIQ